MRKAIVLSFGLLAAACGQTPSPESESTSIGGLAVNSELVAVEFSGSKRTLETLAGETAKLGWQIDTRTSTSLRILPPANYEPSQFGRLLKLIEDRRLNDVGLLLIGPNGPIGPEG